MEHIQKLLGALVVSQYDEGHILQLADVHWAQRVYEYSCNNLRSLVSESELNSEGETLMNRYKAWADGKRDVDSYRLNQWIRRTLKTRDARDIKNFIQLLEGENLGHFEQEDKISTNGKRRMKWVFNLVGEPLKPS